ncbi:MAG: gamma-glutamyl-gamma-aminobutyrate hydrolase family protein, partial [Gammaproteobacteria bacterium]|nr:gamma-glutamyl-gamma-aminobutyrate hydrolase family protein [Gammaproteobacteria bacterium]
APSLQAAARAPDGLIEAFHLPAAPAFTWAVQWHPEWRVMANNFSVALFATFGEAARARATRRQ